jgi:uncharacterized protein YhbP (UPF0306 family)
MGEFAIEDFSVTDVAGRPLESAAISRERIHGRVLGLLEASSLCSIATVTPERTAHANTAFFAYSDALEIFLLSHPMSQHCRNLRSNASVALTVFSTEQRWADPGRGVQLFGTAEEVSGAAAREAERWYETRFPAYGAWRSSLAERDLAREYRFYRIAVTTVKILDEEALGDGLVVRATVVRPERDRS